MNGFLEVLQRHGIPYREYGAHHHTTQGRINLDCPDCSPGSGQYRLGYHLQKNYLTCWVCGYRRIPDTLASLTGLAPREFFHLLQRRDAPGHPRGEARPVTACVPPAGLGDLLPVHRRYLEGRGYDPDDLAARWEIRGIGLAPRLRWRVYIPIHQGGKVVSWTTRSVSNEVPDKYRSAGAHEEEIPAKTLLYGEDHCRHAVVAVEGPLDAWKVGFGAAATFGLKISQAQVARLARYPVRVICLDSEPEAQRKARWLLRTLAVFPGRTHNVVLESGKDPGEASPEELAELRRRFLE